MTACIALRTRNVRPFEGHPDNLGRDQGVAVHCTSGASGGVSYVSTEPSSPDSNLAPVRQDDKPISKEGVSLAKFSIIFFEKELVWVPPAPPACKATPRFGSTFLQPKKNAYPGRREFLRNSAPLRVAH